MADEADITAERMELQMAASMKEMRGKTGMEVEAIGSCLNCDEPLPSPMRWCDAHCQHDWQRRKDNK